MQIQDKLRFGIVGDPKRMMAWQVECLRVLRNSGVADLVLVVGAPEENLASGRRETAGLGGLAFRLYQRMAERSSRAVRMIDYTSELKGVLQEHVAARGDEGSPLFSEGTIERIRSRQLDFLLLFGIDDHLGEANTAARYGVWSFTYGDGAKYPGGPVGFWEIYRGDAVCRVALARLAENRGSGVILQEGFFPAIVSSWSRTRDVALFGAAEWPARVCRDVVNGCADYVDGGAVPSVVRSPVTPTNRQAVAAVVKMAAARWREQILELLVREQWHVGIVRAKIGTFLDERASLGDSAHAPIEWLQETARTRFFADPFAIKRGREISILVEDFDQVSGSGVISAIHSSDDGKTFSAAQRVTGGTFDTDGHKSYPYVIEFEGEVYCVPESSAEKHVVLHRALQFPFRWERVGVLLEGTAAIDPTLFAAEGRWWMFYTTAEGGSNIKLHLASAEKLEGPWVAHPANPIKTDVRSARPGGTPFFHEGAWYRPAQDSSRTYGGAMVIHRIDRLSLTQYAEHEVRRITPQEFGAFDKGFHTLSSAGEVCVVDGKRFVLLPEILPGTVRKKLGALLRRWPGL